MCLHVVGDFWESLGLCVFLRPLFFLPRAGVSGVTRHTITRCIASLNGLTRKSDFCVLKGVLTSVDDGVARLAEGSADLGAVLRPLRLQVQLDLRLREPEPWIGPDVAHVEDISVDH